MLYLLILFCSVVFWGLLSKTFFLKDEGGDVQLVFSFFFAFGLENKKPEGDCWIEKQRDLCVACLGSCRSVWPQVDEGTMGIALPRKKASIMKFSSQRGDSLVERLDGECTKCVGSRSACIGKRSESLPDGGVPGDGCEGTVLRKTNAPLGKGLRSICGQYKVTEGKRREKTAVEEVASCTMNPRRRNQARSQLRAGSVADERKSWTPSSNAFLPDSSSL